MKRIEEARDILKELQVPVKQQSDMCCYVLLAMAQINKKQAWSEATNNWIRIHDIIGYIKEQYDVEYAENSRETIRKQALHHYRNAAFIEDNGKATNSPNYRYRLTDEMLAVIQTYGTVWWQSEKEAFLSDHESLVSQYSSKRELRKMPVKINGVDFTFKSDNGIFSKNELDKGSELLIKTLLPLNLGNRFIFDVLLSIKQLFLLKGLFHITKSGIVDLWLIIAFWSSPVIS